MNRKPARLHVYSGKVSCPHTKVKILKLMKAGEATHIDEIVELLELDLSSSEIVAALFELEGPAGLGEGPQADPRDLPGHTRVSRRGTIWFDQPNPAFVCFDRGEPGGRLWPKIRRRDGPFHPDLDGFRSRAFLSSVTSGRPGFFEEHGIFQAKPRF